MATDIVFLSATRLGELIRSKELSSVQVVSAHLDRIEQVNPRVNAIVSMRDRDSILADAEAADRSEPTGPLHGLPVAVKDLEDVAGLPTRSGSTVTSSRPKTADGMVAQRLRAAGAIIIAKTNTPEFGAGSHTFNNVFGITRNPWNLDRSAGGSSGGAAAALASHMLPIADGSDLGGSLRNPAAFCGVVGLRPSIGRVPSLVERSTHLLRLGVQGPMGRTVADTALVLSALGGPYAGDPLALDDDPSVFAEPLSPETDARVAWGADLGLFPVEPEVLSVCRQAIDRVTDVGGSVAQARPNLDDAMTVFRILRGLNYRDLGTRIQPDKHGELKDSIRQNIEYGNSLSVDDVLLAERLRAKIHQEMTNFFRRHDVLALPSAQVLPFPVEQEFPTRVAGQEMSDYVEWMSTCCIISATGCPAISIPAGLSSDGLPVGLQLVAPVGAERRLLQVAHALEAAVGPLGSPPIA